MIFEYLTVNTGGMPISQDNLNKLGLDGWELITVAFDTAYFKRLKSSEVKTAKKAEK